MARSHDEWLKEGSNAEMFKMAKEILRLEDRIIDLRMELELKNDQLPDSMQDCTITFHQCPAGHGWLSATNWKQQSCPTCRIEAAEAETDQVMKERDFAQDCLQKTHVALGGDGEWKGKLPPEPPPDSGDLHHDVPALAREVMQRLGAMLVAIQGAKLYNFTVRGLNGPWMVAESVEDPNGAWMKAADILASVNLKRVEP